MRTLQPENHSIIFDFKSITATPKPIESEMSLSRIPASTFLTLVLIAINWSEGHAFVTPTPHAGDGGFAVNSSYDGSECVCHVQAPSTIQCTSFANTDTLTKIEYAQTQIIQLTARLESHVTHYEQQGQRIDELSSTMLETLETLERIESGHLIATRPEIEQIRRELADMEQLLLKLKNNHTSSIVISSLQAEIANITSLLDELEYNEHADTTELLQQIAELKAKLQDCQESDQITGLYDSWDKEGDQDTCSDLVSVSLPYTVGGLESVYGAWFRDPIKNTRRVYSFPLSNGRYHQYIDTYDTLYDYHSNTGEVTRRLTSNVLGPGLVAYNNSLYYNVYSGRSMAMFDMVSNQELVRKDISGSLYNNQGSYRCGTYTDYDFLTDENGLWVIYTTSSANGFIVVSQLDPNTLDFINTWQTNYPKSAAGNCFITCGVVYCTNGFNSHINKINYKFDTKTSEETFVDIPFDNKYLKTYALNYNPRDQKLYGWDNGHQVIYELTFQGDITN